MGFLHRGKRIEPWTRFTFAVPACTSIAGPLALEYTSNWPLQASLGAVPLGYAIGVAMGARRWLLGGDGERDGRRFVGVLAVWLIVAVPLSLVTAAEFSIVLGMQFSEQASFRLALALSILQLIICTMLPRRWAIGATIAGTAWLATTVSPGMYAIVLVALDATNQGGGLPSGPLTTKEAATICNLGTPQRPVIYHERTGCTKQVALERLKTVASADTAMKKAEVIAGWKEKSTKR